ncbi:LOW QUALITY PROTEIN: acid-sensing ion channel 4-B-like [Amphiura filiformis]|uniref:LOW QUALITY PROTEIN: acid-sensing ion channel 4-B-like n=1 Tax=Amphiura filiformis TaxID=82378 RepID=UPI003B2224FD
MSENDQTKRDNTDDDRNKAKTNYKLEFKEFGGNTTLHGLRYVADSEMHILRRFVWLLILIGLGVWLSLGISDSVKKYLNRPISSVITMNYVNNITFPAVTICNYNLWRASIVSPTQAIMASSIFNLDPNDRMNVNWTAYEIQHGGQPLDMEQFPKLAAHRIEDMLFDCRWRNVVKCTAANFTQIITDWGICYTFNSEPMNALQVKQPGSVNGLSLRLNVEQYEYTYGENTGAGLKVLLHPQGQHPLVKELGFSVAPGFQTSVSVRYNSITNLPDPYRSNCTMRSLLYSKQYTVPLCIRYECKIAYVSKMCGCKDFRYQGDDVRVCSPHEQINCIYPAEGRRTGYWSYKESYISGRYQPVKIDDSASALKELTCEVPQGSVFRAQIIQIVTMLTAPVEGILRAHETGSMFYANYGQVYVTFKADANFTASDIDCDCPVPCSSYIYEGRISMAHWPAMHIASQIERERALNVSQDMSGDFARNNLLDLKIYFEEMSYQKIEQVPDYDDGSLQSDVGGYMGLLCGMSIITVGEFIDFIAILIFKKCQR